MQFLIHGTAEPEIQAALTRHDHTCHIPAELAGDGDSAAAPPQDPQALLDRLARKQWHLVTTDAGLVHEVYEKKLAFSGIIVMMLEDSERPSDPGKAVDRLFDRYQRLTPGRLYTVTPNRVKIRQLPGGHRTS